MSIFHILCTHKIEDEAASSVPDKRLTTSVPFAVAAEEVWQAKSESAQKDLEPWGEVEALLKGVLSK